MEKGLFFKYIIDKYNVKFDLFKVSQLDQYPHIFKMEGPEYNLIIKIIQKSKTYCYSINQLYLDISSINCVEKPILTRDGKFTVSIGNKIVLLYEELQELKQNPSAIWWSNCLGSIHSIKVNKNYKCYYPNDFYNQTLKILSEAEKYILPKRKNKIYQLLKDVDAEVVSNKNNMTLCHNDPYNLNVMSSKQGYKLIDIDSMGLSPKEYDIQRLIYNYVINSNNIDEVIEFWTLFRDNYEKKISNNINIDLLKNIYVLDLIRTISWLYIVSNDMSRVDRKRQKEQLDLFERSLDDNRHCKILSSL